ncbi:uncharacterized protein H6S33_005461 [Morchella sextelata]|uniref:uncharacterized protein n=1 Tax=Morchella sextelata TaxID=1174677 RepID=UPI001D058E8E|nr:uncharacterized protein H6S33_005461 [Morchella sextelata]KAH0613575.1 hypothetical protein H6S33_005461 [Morchella sextelata]
MEGVKKKEKRQYFSEAEKQAICERNNQEYIQNGKRPGWREIASWFAETHNGKKISQAGVSTILSKRSADLLGQSLSAPQAVSKRRRAVYWPKLDDALFEWHMRMQGRVTITGLVIKEKAAEFFPLIYPGEEAPKFSDGWLTIWKKRHSVKQIVQHGEASDALRHHCVLALDEMNSIRQLLEDYHLQDIYNFDETGYFFRMQPDRRLSTTSMEGEKKDKLRITVALTCNGTGSHKLPPWIIGRAENPRCLKNINRDSLGAVYRFNETAWMKHDIMVEYLHWFDRKMRGRKVVLLMDNFSAHELGVRLIGGEKALENTLIVWLPANTTSVWQPLDQGIIQAWKAHTKRHQIRHLVREVERTPEGGKIPKATLLQAIRWAVEAWNTDLKPSTIFNCFTKSTVKFFGPIQLRHEGDNPEPLLNVEGAEIEAIIAEVQQDMEFLQGVNHLPLGDDINLDEFFNPIEERVDDELNQIEPSILNHYLPVNKEEQLIWEEADSDEPEKPEEIPQLKVTTPAAFEHLKQLELYFLQSEDSDSVSAVLTGLTNARRVLEDKRKEQLLRQPQQKLTDFFSPTNRVFSHP